MTRARDIANLVDANGDIVAGALDNVPASNDASALTTGTLGAARLPTTGVDASSLSTGTLDGARLPSTLPAVDGSALTGVIADLVDDSTPQLGGALDAQSYAITSVGNMTARTEGNATTFDIRAGSLKAAMHYNHSSNSIDHSLNASSATDSGSGIWRINYSNNFNQTRPYAMNNAHQMFHHIDGVDGSTTSYCKFKTRDGSKNPVDSSESSCAVHGSLA
jgi:hypothetical protein